METTYIQLNTSDDNSFITSDNNNFFVKHYLDSGFSIELFKNSSESNRVDKTNYIELIDVISGVIREQSSILNMVLTIEYDKVPNFNYVYIPIFNRYYYVDDIVSVTNKLWAISLSVDVLMTYKTDILNQTAFITRNEKVYDEYLIDDKRLIAQNVSITELDVTSNISLSPTRYTNSCVLSAFNCSTRIVKDGTNNE